MNPRTASVTSSSSSERLLLGPFALDFIRAFIQPLREFVGSNAQDFANCQVYDVGPDYLYWSSSTAIRSACTRRR